MSVLKNAKALGVASMQNIRLLATLTPVIKKIVSAHITKESLLEGMSDDIKMKEIAETIYSKLPERVKAQMTEEFFVGKVIEKKTDLLGIKKVSKKVSKERKKKKSK